MRGVIGPEIIPTVTDNGSPDILNEPSKSLSVVKYNQLVLVVSYPAALALGSSPGQLTETEQGAIRLLLEALREKYARAILFGSKARGDSDQDSDIDLLILAEYEN